MTTVNVPRCSIEHILHAKWSVNSCRSQQPPNSRYFNRIFFHLKEKKWRGYGQGSHEWEHLLCHQNVRYYMYVVRAMEGLARACSLSASVCRRATYYIHSTSMMHKRATRPIIKYTCPSCPKPPAAADFLHINMTLATIGIKQTLVAPRPFCWCHQVVWYVSGVAVEERHRRGLATCISVWTAPDLNGPSPDERRLNSDINNVLCNRPRR